jgi:hypothetical protein
LCSWSGNINVTQSKGTGWAGQVECRVLVRKTQCHSQMHKSNPKCAKQFNSHLTERPAANAQSQAGHPGVKLRTSHRQTARQTQQRHNTVTLSAVQVATLVYGMYSFTERFVIM